MHTCKDLILVEFLVEGLGVRLVFMHLTSLLNSPTWPGGRKHARLQDREKVTPLQ